MKRNHGFSLIEVMVTMGILSIAAYVIMHTTEMKSKNRRTERANEELKVYFRNIEGLLNRGPYCVASLHDVKINPASPNSKYNFSAVKTPVHYKKYEIGQILETLVVLEELALTNIIPADEENSLYLATIEASFRKKGKIYGGKFLTKSFDLEIVLDEEGKIVECWPLSSRPKANKGLQAMPDVKDVLEMEGQNMPSQSEIDKAIEENPYIKELYERSQEIQETHERINETLNQ